MTGDQPDILQRLRLTLPTRWFNDVSPVLEGILTGFSAAWSTLYRLLMFVKGQSRIRTISDSFLDLAASDFFDSSVLRRAAENDDAFRARVQHAMLRKRATRDALVNIAADSGFAVQIFEAARPVDTGAYNIASGFAWGVAGGWGSLGMPFECLVTAHRGLNAVDTQFWRDMADAMPAGGAAWIRIAN